MRHQVLLASPIVLSQILVALAQTLPTCSVGCFQGTPQNATSSGDASLCPLVPGIATPFLTPSCLCFTPESFSGPSPFTYCFTCGSETSGDFSTVCGESQVTQTCSNQDDAITKVCNANSDVNEVLGALCEDGKPSSTVTDVSRVVEFVQPELAAGAFSLIALGCVEFAGAQAVSDVVSDLCNVWNIAGCGTVDTASASGSATGGAAASTTAGHSPSTTGKPGSASTGQAASTGIAASAGTANITAASTGSTNITSSPAAAASTSPASSSTGSAVSTLSGLRGVAYTTLSAIVLSGFLLANC